MTDDEYPQATAAVGSLSPDALSARLRSQEPVSVLDVRNRDEMEAWPLTGPQVTTYHVPYYQFVAAKVNDAVDNLAADVVSALSEPIVVICGRGEASAEVAQLLGNEGVDALNLDRGMRGWASVYDAVTVATDAADLVVQYQRPSSGCLAYLVVSRDEAVVVDPLRAFAARYVRDADAHDATLVAAVDTHVHADHISGVREVASLTDATVVLPTGARDRGLAFDARLLDDGETLAVGDAALTAVALRGHTSEMLGLRLGDLLFAGDTVFLESVARPDLEEGAAGAPAAARQLHQTLRTLDGALRVAPAHFSSAATPDADGAYVADLSTLRDVLPALSMSEAEFVDYVLDDMPPRPANYEEIIRVNLGRDAADEDEAFELELGPNNCAATGSVEVD